MDDKTMVADTLVGIKGELKSIANYIIESDNPQLKQSLKQIRNQCEMSHEEIYQIARSKQYYVPAAKAKQDEIDHVRSILTQNSSR